VHIFQSVSFEFLRRPEVCVAQILRSGQARPQHVGQILDVAHQFVMRLDLCKDPLIRAARRLRVLPERQLCLGQNEKQLQENKISAK